jgi:RNA polymerase-binding transcription factor DksA
MDERTLLMAEALAQSEVEAGIQRAIAQLPKQPEGFNGCCVVCGEELPAARITFGAITCVPCQSLRERRSIATTRSR